MSTQSQIETLAEELERLATLHEKGRLSTSQFEAAKNKILANDAERSNAPGSFRKRDSDIVETYVKLRIAGWIISGVLGLIFFFGGVLPLLLGKVPPILLLFGE